MKFSQDRPHKRISGRGILVLLQDGNVFSSKSTYVGPEPKGSGSMPPKEILEAAAKEVKPVVEKKIVKKTTFKKPQKKGLFVGEKPKRKAVSRVVGKV